MYRIKRIFSFIFIVFISFYFVLNYKNLKISQNRTNREKEIQIDSSLKISHNLSVQHVNSAIQTIKLENKGKSTYTCYDHYNRQPATHKCAGNIEIKMVSKRSDKVDFEVFLDQVSPQNSVKKKKALYMVYSMESEPHIGGGDSWHEADFLMWYNLDLSFPGPATYFDLNSFLPDLLSPPVIEFKDKEKTPIVWIVSNCHAFNGREEFIQRLINHIDIDSYGQCLQNKRGHPSGKMQGNIQMYSKYKFVIAIENSNCEDYVTEKLVHAVASGSIPIVAGRDNKPNYLKYMPKNSYINVYDFKSFKDLVSYLTLVANNEAEYEKHIHFKRGHKFNRKSFTGKPLQEIIEMAKTILNPDEVLFSELVAKEKSESKLCKVARYLRDTPEAQVKNEIKSRKRNRPDLGQSCLPIRNLFTDFIT